MAEQVKKYGFFTVYLESYCIIIRGHTIQYFEGNTSP